MVPAQFSNVTVTAKANVYFDGRVVSHTIRFADGTRKTLGIVYPGEYHFSTEAPERMEIVAGTCQVQLDGESERVRYEAGQSFDVARNSGFTIEVGTGVIAEYICSFL
jgi:purine/pyrimidine-nucleoside phosphorylase